MKHKRSTGCGQELGRTLGWGFPAERSAALRAAASAADGPRARVTALARTYLEFAERNPAVYDALLETLGEVAGDGVQRQSRPTNGPCPPPGGPACA
ncbi:hypothetical protein ACGFYU_02385 [Streptomyces sp. NPDC048337]|uniref:hypothetical protein n=1 Tax=Streptomyces sp. NPDC048337 TaxID=3365535 RepID=UPI00371B3EF4